MKYDFCYKILCNIDQSHVNRLSEYALSQHYIKNAYFGKDLDSNFQRTGKGTVYTTKDIPLADDAIREVVEILDPFFSTRTFRCATFDKLCAMTHIAEHSDASIRNKDGGMIGNPALSIHKIHIPLITNDGVSFMWLEDTPAVGNISMNAPTIREHEPGSLMTSKELAGYYERMPKIDPAGPVIRWKSPIMTTEKCREIAEEYSLRVLSRRTTAFRYFDAFDIPVLMQKYSKDQLLTMSTVLGQGQIKKIEEDFCQERLEFYRTGLANARPLVTTDPSFWNVPTVKPKVASTAVLWRG